MSSRKHISDADRALFRECVGDVKPLEDDRIHAPRRHRRTRSHLNAQSTPAADAVDHMPDSDVDVIEAGARQWFSRGGVQQRLLKRLMRGQLQIQAQLDVHGLTATDARDALARFLDECQCLELRFVRIVHGKGFGSPGAQPVLKSRIDRWLRLRPEVLAFASAPPQHGGTGALNVILKRATPNAG